MWITNNSNNYGFWSNAAYDELIQRSVSGDLAMDPVARWAALHEAEAIVMEEMVILPVYQKANAMMIKSNVMELQCHSIALNRVFKDTYFGE